MFKFGEFPPQFPFWNDLSVWKFSREPAKVPPGRGAKLVHYITGQKRVKSNLSQQKLDRLKQMQV
jgi:hypothetical protein